jgi:hypothetical protein
MDYKQLCFLWTLVELWRAVELGEPTRLLDRILADLEGADPVPTGVALSGDSIAKVCGEANFSPSPQALAMTMSGLPGIIIHGLHVSLVNELPDDIWVFTYNKMEDSVE